MCLQVLQYLSQGALQLSSISLLPLLPLLLLALLPLPWILLALLLPLLLTPSLTAANGPDVTSAITPAPDTRNCSAVN